MNALAWPDWQCARPISGLGTLSGRDSPREATRLLLSSVVAMPSGRLGTLGELPGRASGRPGSCHVTSFPPRLPGRARDRYSASHPFWPASNIAIATRDFSTYYVHCCNVMYWNSSLVNIPDCQYSVETALIILLLIRRRIL